MSDGTFNAGQEVQWVCHPDHSPAPVILDAAPIGGPLLGYVQSAIEGTDLYWVKFDLIKPMVQCHGAELVASQ